MSGTSPSIYSNVSTAARRVVSSIIASPILSGATIATIASLGVAAVLYSRRTTSSNRIAVIQSIGTANPLGTTGNESFLEIVSADAGIVRRESDCEKGYCRIMCVIA